VGLCPERLARIDRHLEQRYLEPRKIAGALTLVARRGRLAYLSPVGMMDLERGRPMRPDTLFRIYSMTKPITSVALMALYEEGRFQLDDPVHRFIPAWAGMGVHVQGNHPAFQTVACERPMSVRDLLSHTSGLTYGFMERTNVDAAYRKLGVGDRSKPGTTLRDLIEQLAGLPLEFQPGTRWNYSVSTDVCGHLVEVLSGQPFDRFLRERIFEPLGMEDTGFFVPESKLARFAANYSRRRDKTLRLEDDPHAFGQFAETTYDGVGFGLGFSVTLDPARAQVVGSPGEYAWGGAASTLFWIDPSEELVVIFLTQFMPSGTFNFRGQLKSLVYSAIVD
jgi:CubicO group peptidase (beta-lactamase class C family)